MEETPVANVSHRAFLERSLASKHKKENHTEGKDVDRLALIELTLYNLWCHRAIGAEHISQFAGAIFALESASKAKINELGLIIVILTEKNILCFQIPVGDSSRVNVLDTLQHLFQEEPTDWLTKGTS